MTEPNRRPPLATPEAPAPLEPVRAVIPADLETPVSVFLKLEGRMLFDRGRLYVVLQFLRNGADSGELPTDLVDSFELVAAPRNGTSK